MYVSYIILNNIINIKIVLNYFTFIVYVIWYVCMLYGMISEKGKQ